MFPQPLGVQIRQIDEPGSHQRGLRRQVDVILDQGGIPRDPIRVDRARPVGEDHDRRTRGRGGAYAVYRRRHAVTLVQMGTGADHEHTDAIGRPDGSEGAGVTEHRGGTESGDPFCMHLGDGLAEVVGSALPPAAESEGDVVVRHSGCRGDVCRGLEGEFGGCEVGHDAPFWQVEGLDGSLGSPVGHTPVTRERRAPRGVSLPADVCGWIGVSC